MDLQSRLRGYMAKQTKFNVQMGTPHRRENWPGDTDIDNSEVGARNFYGRWLQMMSCAPESNEVHHVG